MATTIVPIPIDMNDIPVGYMVCEKYEKKKKIFVKVVSRCPKNV
jgi:hypothetical protein